MRSWRTMGSTIAPSDCSGTFKISSLEEFAWWSCCYWLCTNVSYVQMFHMSKLSFPVYMLMARVSQVQAALSEPSFSTFQSALLRVEFGYLASFNYKLYLYFALLHFEHVSSHSSESLCCMIWLLQFGVLVCFDTRTKTTVWESWDNWS